jgi:hypothetical protein
MDLVVSNLNGLTVGDIIARLAQLPQDARINEEGEDGCYWAQHLYYDEKENAIFFD